MFRGIGGSLGAAVFGTIFTLAPYRRAAGCVQRAARCADRPAARGSPAPARAPARGGARSPTSTPSSTRCSPVFLAAAGVAALGFALSWLLQERPLRETAATSTGLDDSLAAPRSPDSLAEIERALARAAADELRQRFASAWPSARGSAQPGGDVGARAHRRARTARAREQAVEEGVPSDRIAAVVDGASRAGPDRGRGRRRGLTEDGHASPGERSPPGASCCSRRSPTRAPRAIPRSMSCCAASRASSAASRRSSRARRRRSLQLGRGSLRRAPGLGGGLELAAHPHVLDAGLEERVGLHAEADAPVEIERAELRGQRAPCGSRARAPARARPRASAAPPRAGASAVRPPPVPLSRCPRRTGAAASPPRARRGRRPRGAPRPRRARRAPPPRARPARGRTPPPAPPARPRAPRRPSPSGSRSPSHPSR